MVDWEIWSKRIVEFRKKHSASTESRRVVREAKKKGVVNVVTLRDENNRREYWLCIVSKDPERRQLLIECNDGFGKKIQAEGSFLALGHPCGDITIRKGLLPDSEKVAYLSGKNGSKLLSIKIKESCP